MCLKSDAVVAISMRAVLNQEIPIMKIAKPHIGLTKRARLNATEANVLAVTKKIIQKISDGGERYLLIQEMCDA